MTREECIKWLKSLKVEIGKPEHRTLWHYVEAIDTIIEVLSAEVEAAQGVGRYENAMQKLQEMPKYLNGIKAKQINKISSGAAQGEWINREYCQVDEDAYEVATCSNCKSEITIEYPHDNYCPNCGARMKGGEDK